MVKSTCPKSILFRFSSDADWIPILMEAHAHYGSQKTEMEAKVWYLRCVMQYPLYGSTMFPVSIVLLEGVVPVLCHAVSPLWFYIVSSKYRIIRRFGFSCHAVSPLRFYIVSSKYSIITRFGLSCVMQYLLYSSTLFPVSIVLLQGVVPVLCHAVSPL